MANNDPRYNSRPNNQGGEHQTWNDGGDLRYSQDTDAQGNVSGGHFGLNGGVHNRNGYANTNSPWNPMIDNTVNSGFGDFDNS